MKKILTVITILLFTSLSAGALNVKLESMTAVNSETENKVFEAKILQDAKFESGFEFKKNTIMHFDIVEIVPAKCAKRGAYIIIKPVALIDDENIMQPLEETDILGKTKSLKLIKKPDLKNDLKENTKSAAKSVAKGAAKKTANVLLPGSTYVYQISKGLIMPEEGKTRLQSAAGNVVDDSMLKYLKAGKDINIEEGEILEIDFYRSSLPKRQFKKRRK